jgi:CIC family chloride channel protein
MPSSREFEVPRRLRAFVRARETSLVLLAGIAGAISGLVATAMGASVDMLHIVFFGIEPGKRLSAIAALDPRLAVAVPCLGGLARGRAPACI